MSPEKISKKVSDLFSEIASDKKFKDSVHPNFIDMKRVREHMYDFGPATEFAVRYQKPDGTKHRYVVDFVAVMMPQKYEQHNMLSALFTQNKFMLVVRGY